MEQDIALVAMSKGSSVPSARELLEEVLTDLEKDVDKRIYSTVNGSQHFDGTVAIQLMVEKAAYEKIRARLKNLEKRGRAASETLKPMLDGNDA